MPYIKQEQRDVYDDFLNALIQDLEEHDYTPGDVTYAVYKIVGHWFLHKPGYQSVAEIRGMLAGVLSEFDRRYAFPYEDVKLHENGDVDFTPAEVEEINLWGDAVYCGDPECDKCSSDEGDIK